MKRRLVFALLVLFILPLGSIASENINWTFYAPGAAGKMQGSGTTAYPDASGIAGKLHTLDEVRLGQSPYVTVASASIMKGRWYCIGNVTYTSPIDRQTHNLSNVVGYVNDTGCAFNGTCSCGWLPQYCGGQARPDKMDIAVGNFQGWGAGQAAQFVTSNPNSAPKVWQQIASLPTAGSSNNGSACNGIPQESGVPMAARYSPTSIADPYSTFNPYSAYTNPTLQPGTPGMMQAYQGQTFNAGFANFNGQTFSQNQAYDQYGNPISNTNMYTVEGTPGSPALDIRVWPRTFMKGQTVLVYWTSVNMPSNACQVIFQNQLLAEGNSGSKQFKTTTFDATTLTFTLRCTDQNGKAYTASDSTTLQ